MRYAEALFIADHEKHISGFSMVIFEITFWHCFNQNTKLFVILSRGDELNSLSMAGGTAVTATKRPVFNGPLARYVELRVVRGPGMPVKFAPPPRVSDPDIHHGTCVTHVSWCLPESLNSDFLWSSVAGKTFPVFRRMRNPQFCVSGKRPIGISDVVHRPVCVVSDCASVSDYRQLTVSTWIPNVSTIK